MLPVNGKVKTASAEADYIAFGSGDRDMIILPGAGDGFKTVKGSARPASVSSTMTTRSSSGLR